jgi:hypothetical protein
MYLAGVSVRRVEDITEALWGTRVSPSTMSELNQKIYAQIESCRNRPIEVPLVCVSERLVAEAELGRSAAERIAAGGNWRECNGFSRSAGGGRRLEGGQGELDSISAAPERARAEGHAAVCFRQVFGTGGKPR